MDIILQTNPAFPYVRSSESLEGGRGVVATSDLNYRRKFISELNATESGRVYPQSLQELSFT